MDAWFVEVLTSEVVRATFDALNDLHASRIIHGDIPRENLLVI